LVFSSVGKTTDTLAYSADKGAVTGKLQKPNQGSEKKRLICKSGLFSDRGLLLVKGAGFFRPKMGLSYRRQTIYCTKMELSR
jgi:hypothetical protein